MKTRFFAALVSLLAVAALASACGDDDNGGDDDDGTPTGAVASEVNVRLQEWSVNPGQTSAAAGEVTFNIENIGPEHVHEFVIVRTELDPAELPTTDDGSVDEEGEGVEVIEEVEDVPIDAAETLTISLEAGEYALICNIVDEHAGETFVHYELGMRTAFTVQ